MKKQGTKKKINAKAELIIQSSELKRNIDYLELEKLELEREILKLELKKIQIEKNVQVYEFKKREEIKKCCESETELIHLFKEEKKGLIQEVYQLKHQRAALKHFTG